jgi:hypothetical protein
MIVSEMKRTFHCEFEFVGTQLFLLLDGHRIAERVDCKWVSLEPGFEVTDDEIYYYPLQ